MISSEPSTIACRPGACSTYSAPQVAPLPRQRPRNQITKDTYLTHALLAQILQKKSTQCVPLSRAFVPAPSVVSLEPSQRPACVNTSPHHIAHSWLPLGATIEGPTCRSSSSPSSSAFFSLSAGPGPTMSQLWAGMRRTLE
jgi:hypothetical protein